MRSAAAALLALAALLAAAPAALACSCRPRTEAQIIESADVVVVGAVTAVRRLPGDNLVVATIEVARIVKGRVHRQLQVRTRDNSAACGVDFAEGQRVRVAATRLNDGLHTNLCMALSPPRQPG